MKYLQLGLTISLCVYSFVSIYAQTDVLVIGGGGFSNGHYELGGTRYNTKFKPVFQFGFHAKIPFDQQLFFTPGIQYAGKGFAVENGPNLGLQDVMMHYVEFPALLQFQFNKNNNGFFVQAGPSLGAALNGNKDFIDSSGNVSNSNVTIGRNRQWSPYDFSLQAYLGFNSNKWLIRTGYSLGLTNNNNYLQPTVVARTNQLQLQIGYKLFAIPPSTRQARYRRFE